MNCILGIDTSNYKTSVAVLREDGQLVFQRSELLEVEKGKCGLRQSQAYFLHGQRLPEYMKDAFGSLVNEDDVAGVAVSFRPRDLDESYMPVFLAGLQAGLNVSTALGIPVYGFSHQEGHIHAAMKDIGCAGDRGALWGPEEGKKFLFFHLSGGTTEVLLCRRTGCHYSAGIVGGTKDISIGQLLDRAGVQAGFPFPAGRYLDELALSEAVKGMPSRVKTDDGWFNLSGQETQIRKMITPDDVSIVPGMFCMLTDLLKEESLYLSEKYGTDMTVMAGGVAASLYLRKNVLVEGHKISWGSPQLSGDNAVGIAGLGMRAFQSGRPSEAGSLLEFMRH